MRILKLLSLIHISPAERECSTANAVESDILNRSGLAIVDLSDPTKPNYDRTVAISVGSMRDLNGTLWILNCIGTDVYKRQVTNRSVSALRSRC